MSARERNREAVSLVRYVHLQRGVLTRAMFYAYARSIGLPVAEAFDVVAHAVGRLWLRHEAASDAHPERWTLTDAGARRAARP